MSKDLSDTEDFLLDAAKRAASSGWISASVVAVALWRADNLGLADLQSVSGIHKVWTLLGAAVLAAFLSGAKSGLLTFLQLHKQQGEKIAETDIEQLQKNMSGAA